MVPFFSRRNFRANSAFTLIELLVVIAIIAILAIVVVLTLNPVQLLQQSRDSDRLSDMANIQTAINLFTIDQPGISLGSSSVVYVSIPDPTATTTAGDQCQGLGLISLPSGYSYHCAASSTPRSITGTGWIPVNLSLISTGSPLSLLPQDPVSSSSSRLYYTYTTNGTQYELTASLESAKYRLGGSGDVVASDGSNLSTVLAKGTNLNLEPLDYGDANLAGYWSFNEASGTTIHDYSGGGQNLSITGSASWIASGLNLSGGYLSSVSLANPGNVMTAVFFVNYNATTSYMNLFDRSASNPMLWINGASKVEVNGASGGSIYTSPLSYSDGNYHMIVSIASAAAPVSQLYVDGTFIGNIAGTLSGWPNPSTFTLFNRSGSQTMLGSVKEVRFYFRALSAAEISALYNGGK